MKNILLILALTLIIGCGKEDLPAPVEQCCFKVLRMIYVPGCGNNPTNGFPSFEVENVCDGGLDTSKCIVPINFPEPYFTDSAYFGSDPNFMQGEYLCEL